MRISRRVVLIAGFAGCGVLLAMAFLGLPGAGRVPHPYGLRAVQASFAHHTSNAVASVTFDQRALDTAGEEMIMFAAAISAVMLLRRMRNEEESEFEHHYGAQDVFGALRLTGVVYLPVTFLVGWYVVMHGWISPGGGFQGGAVMATAFHLAYVAGDYRVLERLRPVAVLDAIEALAVLGFLTIGLVGVAVQGALFLNWLPFGSFRAITSSGTVAFLNGFVGVEVAAALVVLLARFLDQALRVREHGEARPDE